MRLHSLALVTLALLTFVPRARAAGSKGPAYVCTQVMGVSVTGDWFGAGFESGNDDARQPSPMQPVGPAQGPATRDQQP